MDYKKINYFRELMVLFKYVGNIPLVSDLWFLTLLFCRVYSGEGKGINIITYLVA